MISKAQGMLKISDNVKNGLDCLFASLNSDISKKAIQNSVKQAVTINPSIPFKTDLYASNPGKIKYVEYSILTCFCLAAKNKLSADALRELLESISIKKDTIHELVSAYRIHQEDFFDNLKFYAPCNFLHITQVKWSLMCDTYSTNFTQPGELSYKIQLGGIQPHLELKVFENISFLCTTEQLQSLINKLKEIERHCNRIAANK